MKKYNIILAFVLILFSFIACEKDDPTAILKDDIAANALQVLSATDYVLTMDNAVEIFETFTWTAVDFGIIASVNYSVEMDTAGNSFANAVELVLTNNELTASITISDMNKKLMDLGFSADEVATVEIRVTSTINDNVAAVYSNICSVNVTPYLTDFEPIYMIGSALQGWDAGLAVEVEGIALGLYETTTNFTKGGHFRFFAAADWSSEQWGYDYFTGTVTDLLAPETSHDDPNYRFDGGTGNYKITVDLNAKSIAMELVGDVEPEEPEDFVFGIVGNAYEIDGDTANWGGNDVDDAIFTYASNDGDVYTYSISKLTLLADGEFKVRKDRDWVVSYGFSDITIEGDPTNFVDAGGNIKVVARKTYSIDFILDVENDTKQLVFTELPEYPSEVFLVGSINGWDNNGLYVAGIGSDIHVAYQYLDDASEFKILITRGSWDGAWGVGASAGEIADGGGNIIVSGLPTYTSAGFYEIKLDMKNGTVALTPVAIGVIGSAQAGDWTTDVDLTYNETTKVWEGQVTFFDTGEYKFRANDDWAISFGGTLETIEYNGGNMATPGAGTYDFTLDISGAVKFSATVTIAK